MATVDFTRIASNIAALNALNSLRNVNSNLSTHQTRLATGKRINEAMDDPAGLTLATKFLRRAEGIEQAISNIGDAKNLLAVGEGSLNKVQDILGKMRVKAEQAASDTLGASERAAIAGDLAEFAKEIDNIVDTTQWNGNKLLDASVGTFNFQTSSETDTSGYTTYTQSTNHHVDGGALSGLATVAANSSVTESTDPGSLYTTSTAAVFSNVTELTSGSYTVVINIGTTDGSTADSTIQILDSNNQPVYVDADGSEGGLIGTSLSFAYNAGSGSTVDFGNGVSLAVATGLSAGTQADAELDYTKAGSYSVTLTTAAQGRSYMDTVDAARDIVSSSLASIGSLMARLTSKEETLSVAHINTEAAFSRIMNADMAMEQLNAVKFQILQQTATVQLAQANSSPQNLLQLFR